MATATEGRPAKFDVGQRQVIKQRSLWRDAFELFLTNRLAMFGLVIAIFFLGAAIFGPMLSSYDYTRQDLLNVSAPPSVEHWFGTDQLGRDFLTRILYAARTALVVALVVTGISTVIGTIVGAVAAYMGGWVDAAISRVIDILMAIPNILVAIFISATIEVPVTKQFDRWYAATGWEIFSSTVFVDYMVVFLALGIIGWASIARLVRGQIISLRERDFIMAERALGAPSRTILLQHLIPNALGPVIVAASLRFGDAVMLEASLSYLGIGIQPPGASWGAMINENLSMWRYKPYLVVIPAATLAIVMYGFSCIGDGLVDALNPRMRRR